MITGGWYETDGGDLRLLNGPSQRDSNLRCSSPNINLQSTGDPLTIAKPHYGAAIVDEGVLPGPTFRLDVQAVSFPPMLNAFTASRPYHVMFLISCRVYGAGECNPRNEVGARRGERIYFRPHPCTGRCFFNLTACLIPAPSDLIIYPISTNLYEDEFVIKATYRFG